MYQVCAEVIWLTKLVSTYCMRERGHPGKHWISNREPSEKDVEDLKAEYNKESLDARQSNK